MSGSRSAVYNDAETQRGLRRLETFNYKLSLKFIKRMAHFS